MSRRLWSGMVAGVFLCLSTMVGNTQTPSAGQAELQRCTDRIATVQREVLNRYDSSLVELQQSFQKAADLEGALATRTERQRAGKEGVLAEQHVVAEPRPLRVLQLQIIAKMQELVTQVVHESLPRLLEAKRTLTVAGSLDEAVALRDAIARLQAEHLPLVLPDPSVAVPVDTLLLAYSADRARADKTYRGQKFTVRGVLSGYRPDPADSKQYLLYLGGNSGGWIQCSFAVQEFNFREDKQFNSTFLAVVPKGGDGGVVRIQKGQNIEVRGTCDGFDESVRFTRCELVR